ncbi:MAG TPA: class F sortase [Ktedonobacteraceae bacterium]|nr:class F sortase [Ktedonobacteraceae bacterium]
MIYGSLSTTYPQAPSSHTSLPDMSVEDTTTRPVHLLVPSIKVNAFVEPVGVLANGDLETPTQNPWYNVGWYESGTLPGEQGSAVIDGHLDRPGGSPAVFWNLRHIHTGAAVIVIDAQGRSIHFHVTRVAFYPPQAAPLQEIFGNGGGTYLNLITCAGDWIPSERQTTLRQVIYTTLG